MKNILVVVLLFFTASCVETIVVGSLATAVVVTREKTLLETKNDIIIGSKIDAEFVKEGLKTPKDSVSVMVNEGRVLLIGVVREREKGKLANDISWKVSGVKEVIDEIQISQKGLGVSDVTDILKDSYLTSFLKTRLFLKPQLKPSNFKITTVSGAVYVLGTAQDADDMKNALALIAKTRGVKKVVNHIILANDSRRQ